MIDLSKPVRIKAHPDWGAVKIIQDTIRIRYGSPRDYNERNAFLWELENIPESQNKQKMIELTKHPDWDDWCAQTENRLSRIEHTLDELNKAARVMLDLSKPIRLKEHPEWGPASASITITFLSEEGHAPFHQVDISKLENIPEPVEANPNICSTCNGTGVVVSMGPPRRAPSCVKCGGSGILPKSPMTSEDIRTISDASHSALVERITTLEEQFAKLISNSLPLKCPVCQGRGEIPERVDWSDKQVPCPGCCGTGIATDPALDDRITHLEERVPTLEIQMDAVEARLRLIEQNAQRTVEDSPPAEQNTDKPISGEDPVKEWIQKSPYAKFWIPTDGGSVHSEREIIAAQQQNDHILKFAPWHLRSKPNLTPIREWAEKTLLWSANERRTLRVLALDSSSLFKLIDQLEGKENIE